MAGTAALGGGLPGNLPHRQRRDGAAATLRTAAADRGDGDAALRATALLVGLAGATAIRAALPQATVPAALGVGVGFALALLGLVWLGAGALRRPIAAPRRGDDPRRLPFVASIGVGVAGAGLLCALPIAHRLASGMHLLAPGAATYLPWAATVVLISVAEEKLLRGVLFDAVERVCGEAGAVTVTAAAFALVHVPSASWGVVPLDLGVGVALGCLRLAAGRVAAPAVAHALADLVGWWL